jgi:hypothetical protein
VVFVTTENGKMTRSGMEYFAIYAKIHISFFNQNNLVAGVEMWHF